MYKLIRQLLLDRRCLIWVYNVLCLQRLHKGAIRAKWPKLRLDAWVYSRIIKFIIGTSICLDVLQYSRDIVTLGFPTNREIGLHGTPLVHCGRC